jgi:ABC-type dipeptide/oligopeptide/nickel transport system ATPase component
MRLLSTPPARIWGGEILLDGRDLTEAVARPHAPGTRPRDRNGLPGPHNVPQSGASIGRQIMEVLELHKGLHGAAADARAAELLDMVGIPAPRRRLDEYPHQFSGGLCQRE